MKKYTLSFESQELEEKYQLEYDKIIRYPFVQLYGILYIIYGIVLVSMQIVSGLINSEFWMRIVFIVISIFLIFFNRRYKRISSFVGALMILAIQAQQIFVQQASHIQINLICVTLIVTITVTYLVEFKLSFACIILQTLMQLIAIYYYTGYVPFQNIFTTFGICCLFTFARYKLEYINRNRFLFTQKDKEWSEILKLIVNRPYLLFYFDPQQFSFILKNAGQDLFFECQTTQDLKIFIRESHIQQQTLEQFLFYQLSRDQSIFKNNSRQINLSYKKKKYSVTITNSFIIHNCFLIVFDQDSEQVELIKSKSQITIYKIQKKVQILLHNNISILKQFFTFKNIKPLKQYILQQTEKYFELRNFLGKNNLNIQPIILKDIFKEIETFSNQKIKFYDKGQELTKSIYSDISLLYPFFIKVLEVLKFQNLSAHIDLNEAGELYLKFQRSQMITKELSITKWILPRKFDKIIKNSQKMMDGHTTFGISAQILNLTDLNFK